MISTSVKTKTRQTWLSKSLSYSIMAFEAAEDQLSPFDWVWGSKWGFYTEKGHISLKTGTSTEAFSKFSSGFFGNFFVFPLSSPEGPGGWQYPAESQPGWRPGGCWWGCWPGWGSHSPGDEAGSDGWWRRMRGRSWRKLTSSQSSHCRSQPQPA